MIAEVAQAGGARKLTRRPGDEDLAAVPGRGDPCGAVHVDADVALIREQRLSGVKPHSHADRTGRESLASVRCRSQRIRRLREGHEEGVPLRVDLDAIVSRKSVT